MFIYQGKIKLSTWIFLAKLLIIFGVQQSYAFIPGKTYDVILLHTNDMHGHVEKYSRLFTVIEDIRRSNPDKIVLLLSAGDINTGHPVSDFNFAIPDILAMNTMGYAATAVGNHEFDKSLKALQQQVATAKFPFVAANIFHKATGELLFAPYVVRDFDGLKFSFMGLTTEDTPKGTKAYVRNDFAFRPPAGEAKKYVTQMKEEADVHILLSHLGYFAEEVDVLATATATATASTSTSATAAIKTSDEESKDDISEYAVHLREEHASGDGKLVGEVGDFDFVVGGHTQIVLDPPVEIGKTTILQAGEFAKFLGKLEFSFKDGVITKKSYQIIPITDDIIPHPAISDLLAPFFKGIQEKLDENVGIAADDFYRPKRDKSQRIPPSPLGRLTAKAHRLMTGADMGYFNGRALRGNLKSGAITYGHILEMLPFGNPICTVNLSGEEFRKFLSKVPEHMDHDSDMAQIEKKLADGTPITVAMNNFLAGGGDNFSILSHHPHLVETAVIDSQAVKDFISAMGTLHLLDFQY